MIKLPIKSYEIEVTTRCNAMCLGCARTRLNSTGKLEIHDLSSADFIKIFEIYDLNDVVFFFCGTLGDCIMHPDIITIFEFLIGKNANIDVHTNGGVRSTAFWKEMASLSKLHRENNNRKLNIRWNVDGIDTNQMYRIGVDINKVLSNMRNYNTYGGDSTWYYILFEWNQHEIDKARSIADSLDIKFFQRTAWRNKNKNFNILSILPDTPLNKLELECKHKNRPELFINYDKTVWPCCYLRDEQSTTKSDINKLFNRYGKNFNLISESAPLDVILSHPFYTYELETLAWDNNHELFLSRCYRSCGDNGSRLAKNKNTILK